MKNYLLIACLFALGSCSKNNDVAPSGSYIDANGTWVSVANTQWYLTRIGTRGGEVHVKLDGTTNADKIAIRTSGDGLLSDLSLPIDADKGFGTDVVNSFSISGVPAGKFVTSTQLIAYRGSDVFTITLKSDTLKY